MKPSNDSSLWERNDIQYPRLIAEILAAGALTEAVRTLICDSMDLEPEELNQLCTRAENDGYKSRQLFATHLSQLKLFAVPTAITMARK